MKQWNADLQTYVEVQEDNKISELEYRISKLESLLQAALGPCNQCRGTGMIYVGSEGEGRSLPEPCDSCNGSGKVPLDVADMMEKFKKEAREEIESLVKNELPF